MRINRITFTNLVDSKTRNCNSQKDNGGSRIDYDLSKVLSSGKDFFDRNILKINGALEMLKKD